MSSETAQTMPQAESTLDELMRRALAGDAAAYTQALTQMSRLARAIISQKISQPDVQEDIVQDVLLSVHQARHTWDGIRPIKPWFYAITRYRLMDALRVHYRNREDLLADPQEMNLFRAPVTEPSDLSESLGIALAKLPEPQKTIVELMKIQGLSAQDVALRLGMTVSAVKVSAHRAYKKLRTLIESD